MKHRNGRIGNHSRHRANRSCEHGLAEIEILSNILGTIQQEKTLLTEGDKTERICCVDYEI